MEPNTIALLSLAATALAPVIGVWQAWGHWADHAHKSRHEDVQQSHDEFRRARRFRAEMRPRIAEFALALAERSRAHDLPLLTKAGWIPAIPVPLERVTLTLDARPVAPSIKAKLSILPLEAPGRRYETYSDAITALDRPVLWFNGPSYLLRGVSTIDNRPSLVLAKGRYFDHIDDGELLEFDIALQAVKSSPDSLSNVRADLLEHRRLLRNPLDLENRRVRPGVNTLTIIRDNNDD